MLFSDFVPGRHGQGLTRGWTRTFADESATDGQSGRTTLNSPYFAGA
jgi:hypothetical protein